jgi:hypothetical protein
MQCPLSAISRLTHGFHLQLNASAVEEVDRKPGDPEEATRAELTAM